MKVGRGFFGRSFSIINDISPARCFITLSDQHKVTVLDVMFPLSFRMTVPFNALRGKVILVAEDDFPVSEVNKRPHHSDRCSGANVLPYFEGVLIFVQFPFKKNRQLLCSTRKGCLTILCYICSTLNQVESFLSDGRFYTFALH